jgi:hypothetical protein
LTVALTERLASALSSIEAAQGNGANPAEVRDLLAELRSLLIDLDHSRRHYRRATKLAAVEFVKLGRPPSANVD